MGFRFELEYMYKTILNVWTGYQRMQFHGTQIHECAELSKYIYILYQRFREWNDWIIVILKIFLFLVPCCSGTTNISRQIFRLTTKKTKHSCPSLRNWDLPLHLRKPVSHLLLELIFRCSQRCTLGCKTDKYKIHLCLIHNHALMREHMHWPGKEILLSPVRQMFYW